MATPLDFPISPTNGQKHPQPPVAGQAVYTWDSEKWTTAGPQITGAPPATALPLMDQPIALVGVATKYAREDHVHPGDTNTVRLDIAQTTTATQRQQARANIYAAPFDAMSINGLQLNGGIEVDQPYVGAAHTFAAGVVNKDSVDGWFVRKTGTNAFTLQRIVTTIPGYNWALKMTVTTAQASIGSDTIVIENMIEGYRFNRLRWGTAQAQPLSIGFWVRSSVTGALPLQISNSALNSFATGEVTINEANTPQWVTATFAPVTTGTWLTTNGIGARIGMVPAKLGSMNIAAVNGSTLEITGMIVLPGNEVPSAERSPFTMRQYDLEFIMCQRYFQRTGTLTISNSNVLAGGYVWGCFLLPVTMRVNPTVAVLSPAMSNCGTPTVLGVDYISFTMQTNAVVAGAVNAGFVLTFDARL